MLNAAGAVMLVTSVLSAGGAVWLQQHHEAGKAESSLAENGWKDDTLPLEDSKSEFRQREALSGKIGALVLGFWRVCETIASPENAGMGIATILLVGATCCFAAANRS
jgi:hypothetical protein